MPINDNEIDLTIDNKFHLTEWDRNKHSDTSYYRITTGKYRKTVRMPLIEEAVFSFETFPWKKKESECHTLKAKRLRQTEDYISNEANCVIRLTSDNHIMQIGSSEDLIRHEEVMEEFMYELLGYFPYSAIHRCWRCGKLYVARTKEFATFCPNCENDTIPWKRYRPNRRFA